MSRNMAISGKIVETWAVDDEKQIKYVKIHGSAFQGVYQRVQLLAEKAEFYLNKAVPEFSEERESFFIELCELPFKRRFMAGIRVIFGRYQEI